MSVTQPLVVMPAWNESATIGATILELRRTNPDVPVLVVDDGSGDDTGDRARAAGATVLRLPFNLGVGGAMRAGFRHAVARGHDAVVQLDADGQHDPASLASLLAALDDADLVIGARFAGEGDYTAGIARRAAMRLLATVLSRLARTRLTDTTSGFRASGPRALALFARDYPVEYLGDTVESLATAIRSGLTVTQVPVAMRPRAGGRPSQSPLRAAMYLLRALLVLVLALLRRTRAVTP